MKKELRKLLFISLPSILVILAILEIGMRIAGNLYNQYHNPDNYARIENSEKGKFNILCLGDSYTQGVGAGSTENTYPEQLEKLLQENISKNINVINRGKGGLNSSSVAKNLQEDINRYHPDIAIVMIGCNNFWNLEDLRVSNVFKRLKIYKLVENGWVNFKYRINKGDKLGFKKDGICYKSTYVINPLSFKFEEEGNIAIGLGDNDLAIQKLKKAIEIDKNNIRAWLTLTDRYALSQEYGMAKKEIWKIIITSHDWDDNNMVYALNCVITKLLFLKDYNKELIRIKQYLKTKNREDKIRKLIMVLDSDLRLLKQRNVLDKALEYDLKDIIKLARENKVVTILQTYPHAWRPYNPINDVIKKVAYRYNVPIVDNEMIFAEKLKYSDESKFFVKDGHCNKEGYGIIAENVYSTLLGNRIVLLTYNKYAKQ